jgi:ADP-ribosylglycohydrolase
MTRKAWQRERQLRDAAVPMDRRIHDSNWYHADFDVPYGDDLIRMFWKANVPGSGAPEIPYQEMIQAKGNQGYDVSRAEALLDEGLAVFEAGDKADLRMVTAALLAALVEAPPDETHRYHGYAHPDSWQAVKTEMGERVIHQTPAWDDGFRERIYRGWVGQLAGGAFGTAIEGYTGEQIKKVYGRVDGYITEPETINDDVVYELVLLDVFERMGREITSEALGLEWVRQIPFGWSAEWVALRNLSMGLMPPESGEWNNPYSDWIGVQMRGMIGGMLAPAEPLEAARLAHIDGVVSHSRNGVYGGMYAAALTALAFREDDVRALLRAGLDYVPQGSEYAAVVRFALDTLAGENAPADAWARLEKRLETYNWIHAYPNIAAVCIALWYGEGDFTETMALLAQAGNDVDCNAGLVGSVLGVIAPVPPAWAEPIGDLLETYIKGKERLSIRALAERTARLAKEHRPG